MLFKYIVFDKNGKEVKGQIDTHSKESAIESLQGRGYIVSSIKEANKKGFFERTIILGGVSQKEIVILSKQLSTLFEAQVSAIRIFRMISAGQKNLVLRDALVAIGDDIADGSSVANAMKKHPKVFSHFFVNMIAAGEESGRMSQTFGYLADYLERSYELSSKVKGALIYPAFVVVVFIIVMYLMLTMVIPKISGMLKDSGTELPFVTKIVIGMSDFLVDYGFIFILVVVVGGFFLVKYIRTGEGKEAYDRFKVSLPLFSNLYKQLFIARVAGNFSMMLQSGVSMIKTIENTSKVVDNKVYERILEEVALDVGGGKSLSQSFAKHPEFDQLFIKMTEVGEESGKLSDILGTLAKFYEKEVMGTVGKMVTLIQPILLTALGGGVGLLLSAVLLPIYSVTKV